MSNADDDGFVSRWSRRKALARQGALPADQAPPQDPAALTPSETAPAPAAPTLQPPPQQPASDAPPDGVPTEPPPTLDDVARLTRDSDFRRFVAHDVEPAVKNAALKKLFGDPLFNVMDGLDVYIDDYSRPDPLPAASVRKMAQAAFLGLLNTEPTAPASTEPAVPPPGALPCAPEADENADLRLQPHDAAGCAGPEPRAAADGTGEP